MEEGRIITHKYNGDSGESMPSKQKPLMSLKVEITGTLFITTFSETKIIPET